MERAPLADQLAKRTWIGDFVHRNAGVCVTRDVADAIATGLHTVHVHGGERVEHVGRVFERNQVNCTFWRVVKCA